MAEIGSPQDHLRNRVALVWGRFVLRWRWPLLALTLVLGASAAYGAATRLRVDSSSEVLLGSGSEYEALQRLQDTFGQDRVFVVQIAGDVFSEPYLRRLRALHEELSHIDFDVYETPDAETSEEADPEGWGGERGGTVVEESVSLINVRRTRWRDGGVSVEELMDPWPAAERLPDVRREVLDDPTLVGQVVDATGEHSAVVLRATRMSAEHMNELYEHIRAIMAKHQAPGFDIVIAGFPAIEAEMFKLMNGDIVRLFALSSVLMIFFLGFLFRRAIGIVGPLAVVFQAVLWTFGLMAFSGATLTPITSVLSSFLICVGIGDAVHVMTSYREHFSKGLHNRTAVEAAVESTAVPIFYTSVTTMAGLLSFQAATLGSVRDLGLYGALGVFFALLHSLVFLPILLSFNTRGIPAQRREPTTPTQLDRFLQLSQRIGRSRSTPILAAAFTIASIAGISTVRVEHDPLVWIPEWTGLPAGVLSVDRHLGGSSTIQLMVSVPQGHDVTDHEVLAGLEKLERHVRAYEDPVDGARAVVNVTSVLDAVRETSRAFHQGAPEWYRLPEATQEIKDLLTVFESAATDPYRRLVTVDARTLLMTLRVRWMEASRYAPLKEHVDLGAAKFLPAYVHVQTTGSVYANLAICDSLLLDLTQSTLTALAAIAVLMLLLLRSVAMGLLAMVPNLLPVIGTLGFAGWAGLPIDLSNIMVASIIIGIAVDDTVHFMHHFAIHRRAGLDTDTSISYTFAGVGRPIVTTSIVLASSFLVFLAGDMANSRQFGGLIAVSVVVALLADVWVAPAVLRLAFSRKRAASSASGV